MITENIKKYIGMFCVGCGFAAALTACTEWDDHYDVMGSGSGANLSLWEQLQSRQELSDFCEVLKNTEVFRMHKKTGVTYADLLNQGQAFTVVAPVNGSFNKDSLIRLAQTASGDSIVEKKFVFNHISRSTTSMKTVDQVMTMLNGKYFDVTASTIHGVAITTPNNHCTNGVLHIASQQMPYSYNLYEALCDIPEMSPIGAQLQGYDWDEFNPDASVSSGIIEGVPVYVDSVVNERNRMIESIGLINHEDSTYWVVAPSAPGWQRAWDDVSSYFVYPNNLMKADSLQRYWTNRALLEDAVFNMTDQRSTQDSLISVPYLNWRRGYLTGRPYYHLFRTPFAPGGILYGARRMECTNGTLFVTDEWPFSYTGTFFKDIWVEAEDTWNILTAEEVNVVYSRRSEQADSISQNAYLNINSTKNNLQWELTFRLSNTLSGAYDVCAIVLPRSVAGLANTKPCKLEASINYIDINGEQKTFQCSEDDAFISDPEKVDTLVLAEAFHFPTCNYNQNNSNITLKLKCAVEPNENRYYSRETYLDCIYLRPRTSDSLKNNDNE